MSRVSARVLYWSPRILAILFAAFISIFALDVFGETHGFVQTALALAIHLIPTAIVAAILIVAWQWEWVGAALFLLFAAWYAWWALPKHLDWVAIISTPLLVIAALFLAGWIERAKLHPAP